MRKLGIISILLISFIFIANYAYATVSASIIATASKTTLKKGEEFTVSVYLDKLNYTNKGVDEVELKININKNILNELNVDSIVTKNGNVTIGNNTLKVEDVNNAKDDQVVFSNLTSDCDYKIFIDMKEPLTKSKNKLLDIKFKVKNSVPESYLNVDIDKAISISADFITQITAEDLKNNITADTGKSSDSNVAIFIKDEIQQDDEDNTNTNKDDTNTDKDDDDTNKGENPGENTDDENNAGGSSSGETNPGGNSNGGSNAGGSSNGGSNAGGSSNGGSNAGGSSNGGSNAGGSSSGGSNGGSASGGQSANPTTASGILPAAGFKLFILPVVIGLAVLIYSYKKYSEYRMIK